MTARPVTRVQSSSSLPVPCAPTALFRLRRAPTSAPTARCSSRAPREVYFETLRRREPYARRLVIEVAERDGVFHVTIDGTSQHTVRVPDDYLAELDLVDVDRSALVRASVEFLLEREPKESIMRTFDLPVIERYFPEYRGEIVRRLR